MTLFPHVRGPWPRHGLGLPADDAAAPPTPVGPEAGWTPDVLDGFERRSLALNADRQGPNVVTVVRRRAASRHRDPCGRPFVAVHGWSDYFYNAPLAEAVESAGYAFHAVDLRHHGRSLRPGQTPGFVDRLDRHHEDLDAALALIAEDHPAPPVVEAHSTGGLTTALWAADRPEAASALVLNSPWLQTHGGPLARAVAGPAVRRIARRDPYEILPLPRVDHYWRSLSAEADGEWDLEPAWRDRWAFAVPAGWLAAVLDGHTTVARGLDLPVPVLVLVSDRGGLPLATRRRAASSDVILSPRAQARAARRLGPGVVVHRCPGALHDVFASAPPVRRAALDATLTWLAETAPPRVAG